MAHYKRSFGIPCYCRISTRKFKMIPCTSQLFVIDPQGIRNLFTNYLYLYLLWFAEKSCGRISSLRGMVNGMTGFQETAHQGKQYLPALLEQGSINIMCRLAEESIRLQELVGAINRGTITTENFKELQLPFTAKLPADEVAAPKEGGAGRRGPLMPMAIKLMWNSLPVPRQQQFISHALSVWSKLEKTLVGKAIMRVWREDSDRDRAAYIQFSEPENSAQLVHIGKIKLTILMADDMVFGIDNAPAKARIVLLNESGTDSRKVLYGINISIRNLPTSIKGSDQFSAMVGGISPALLGGQLTDWISVPRTAKIDADMGVGSWFFCKIHGLAAEYLLSTGQTSLDMTKPYEGICMFETMPKALLNACHHCGAFGRHEATLEGKPSCDTSGHCQYCGMDTQKSTFLLHEKECPDKGVTRKCFRCKGSLKNAKHSPVDTTLCKSALEAKAKADRRRREFQLYYNNKLERNFCKLAEDHLEDGPKILKLRAQVNKSRDDLERYVSSTRRLVEAVHPHLKEKMEDDDL